jgi:hypothetical protein
MLTKLMAYVTSFGKQSGFRLINSLETKSIEIAYINSNLKLQALIVHEKFEKLHINGKYFDNFQEIKKYFSLSCPIDE